MDSFDKLMAALVALVVAIVAGLIVWVCLDPSAAACPKGQHDTVISYVPMKAGSVTVMDPIYGCE